MLTPPKIAKTRCSSKVLLKKPCVLAIGLPGEVEGVAYQRDASEQEIYPDIREHPRQQHR
jgi:hypothetical protein